MPQNRLLVGLQWRRLATAVLIGATIAVGFCQPALALITGGEGSAALVDPGWPAGAAAIFNHAARIAWWEGPPFGGGQWHAECRGNAQAFNGVLADFARLDVPVKRVVLHDGVGYSFWLNPNREPAKLADAAMDWTFMVWEPSRWERLRQMPPDLRPIDPRGADDSPPVQLDVYVGGNIRWTDVTVPDGLEILDERLEAHGFRPADGIVLEGKVVDIATDKPVPARIRLQRIEPQSEGGYRYATVSEMTVDQNGTWVLKQTPPGWYRVVAEADGYAARVVGYSRFDEQPRWVSYDCRLAPAADVTGRVMDHANKPLADVAVQLSNVTAGDGGRYESPDESRAATDVEGAFRLENVPVGEATVRLYKAGYFLPGLGPAIRIPADPVDLKMQPSASIRVTVDFVGTDRPQQYLVHMEPEGGSAVGKWSGSGQIDTENRILFQNVPPGRYVLRGSPNPSTVKQQSQPITIELSGGQTAEITLPAQ